MTSNNSRKKQNSVQRLKRDLRYQQLLALAREGNEEAAADLFREYGVEFNKEGSRR